MPEVKPLRILLMEDDLGLAHLCQTRLTRHGYVIDHARDGEEGLAKFAAGKYDVILLDHTMPVYDGLEVIRRLASRGALPPIVMVTGTGNEQVAVEAIRLGARDYVVKDVDGGYLELLPTVVARAFRQQQTEEYMRLAAKVFENVAEGIFITDPQQSIISINDAFTKITGYHAGEVLGKSPSLLNSQQQEAAFYQQMWQLLTETGRWEGEIWDRRKDGALIPVWLTISAVKHNGGSVTNYVGTLMDITYHKQTEERLRYLATHDPLTGLANRAFFEEALVRMIALAARNQELLAIMLLDLDQFKEVNDVLGHGAGDMLLKEAAVRLARCVRESDIVARLGGDEFIVLLSAITQVQEARAIAQRILSVLATSLSISGTELKVSASIGISMYPSDGATPEILVKHADAAMYRAKEQRSCYEFWRESSM